MGLVYDEDKEEIQVREVRIKSVNYKRNLFDLMRYAWPTRWPENAVECNHDQPPKGEFPFLEMYEDIFGWDNQRTVRDRIRGLFLRTGDNTKRRFGRKMFMGAGIQTLFWDRVLHDRLDYGLASLGNCYGPEVAVDEDYHNSEEAIRQVVRDIAIALTGHNIEFTDKVETGDLPDPPEVAERRQLDLEIEAGVHK